MRLVAFMRLRTRHDNADLSRSRTGYSDFVYFAGTIARNVNPLKGQRCQLVTRCHPGLTYIFNFWHSGTPIYARKHKQNSEYPHITVSADTVCDATLSDTRLTLAQQVAQDCVVERLRAHGTLVRSNVLKQSPAVNWTTNRVTFIYCRRWRLHLIPDNITCIFRTWR